jgi:hypothetical protein
LKIEDLQKYIEWKNNERNKLWNGKNTHMKTFGHFNLESKKLSVPIID